MRLEDFRFPKSLRCLAHSWALPCFLAAVSMRLISHPHSNRGTRMPVRRHNSLTRAASRSYLLRPCRGSGASYEAHAWWLNWQPQPHSRTCRSARWRRHAPYEGLPWWSVTKEPCTQVKRLEDWCFGASVVPLGGKGSLWLGKRNTRIILGHLGLDRLINHDRSEKIGLDM